MCVIMVKDEGTKLTSAAWDALEEGFMNNPDGAGIAYAVGERVRVVKGLMTWEATRKAIKTARVGTGWLLVHERIATHGGTGAGLTHPFAVTGPAHHKALTFEAAAVLAHNGVLPLPREQGHSDTSRFIVDVVRPLMRGDGAGARTALHIAADSSNRFALATVAGVERFGTWQTDNTLPGWHLSNKSCLWAPKAGSWIGDWKKGPSEVYVKAAPEAAQVQVNECELCGTFTNGQCVTVDWADGAASTVCGDCADSFGIDSVWAYV